MCGCFIEGDGHTATCPLNPHVDLFDAMHVLDLDRLDRDLGAAIELALLHGAPRAEVDRFRMARFVIPVLRSRLAAAAV